MQDWHIPQGVNLAFSTRKEGVSLPPFDSLNLGLHVGDKEADVLANRALVSMRLQLPATPAWLDQIHGIEVIQADSQCVYHADGNYTKDKNQVCVVMTADCLPVLLCDKQGTQVAAVHAGWRGLCDGIIEVALDKFTADKRDVIAYLGPAIGPQAFEVGAEVRQQFTSVHPESSQFFIRIFHDGTPIVATKAVDSDTKYLADLQGLARHRLKVAGVDEIYCVDACTYTNKHDYFSYRRDGRTGRMASFIWLT